MRVFLFLVAFLSISFPAAGGIPVARHTECSTPPKTKEKDIKQAHRIFPLENKMAFRYNGKTYHGYKK